ncbi:MAG: carotenoid oxygenase family protein [Anaerolineae bacterium]
MPLNQTPFHNGFLSQFEEVSVDDLAITEGSIPDWLKGTYVRNGPGQFTLGKGKYWHWFDGLAMPHRYVFAEGHVSFANRYLQTANYRVDNATEKLNFRMSVTDPNRTFWQKLSAPFSMRFTDNTNVHSVEMDGQYVALTERQEAWTFDLNTLETSGLFQYNNSVGNITQTAHPHYDPKTRTIYNLMLRSGLRSAYEIYTLKDRTYTRLAKIHAPNPSYMHSFSMTENYIIITEYPCQLTFWSTLQFLFTDTPYLANFAWRPQQGTIFTVISKASGEVVKQVQADAFFSFHHINAFEDGSNVVVDISAYADSSIIQALYVATMQSDVEYSVMTAEYRRYTIPMNTPSALISVNYDLASDDRIILPRINYNHYNTKPYRYTYGVSTHGNIRDFVNEVVKVDTEQGRVSNNWYIEGDYPSEPVFAPRPGATAEDDGVIMSTVYSSELDKSYLLLLDGQTFDLQARVDLPIRIPFGFHGRWYPNGDMYAL